MAARLLPTLAIGTGLLLAVVFTGSHAVLLNLCRKQTSDKTLGPLPFASAAVVLAQEAAKALVCLVAMLLTHLWQERPSIKSRREDGGEAGGSGQESSSWQSKEVENESAWYRNMHYAVPALCYAVNNNLAVMLQDEMDPATFQVLCNLKTLTTALFYGWLISFQRVREKRTALALLVLAGVVNSYGGLQRTRDEGWAERRSFLTPWGLGVMLLYCGLSGFAGVYTEIVFKRYGREPFFVQGMKLYSAGVLLNAVEAWRSGVFDENLWRGFEGWTWVVVATQAANGLLYGAVMKYTNSLVRLCIVAVAMVLASTLARWQLQFAPSPHLIAAAFLVLMGLYLYQPSKRDLASTIRR